MMKEMLITMSLITVLGIVPMFAQESGQTAGDPNLQGSLRTRVIQSEADSLERDIKLLAINDIEALIDEGNLEDEEIIFDILSNLAGQGVTDMIYQQGRLENNYPDVRREAARLLGQLGSEQAARRLESLLLSEEDQTVLSQAIISLASLDVEDTVTRNRIIAVAANRSIALQSNEMFAHSFLEAVYEIATREGDITDPMLFEQITNIANARGGYNRLIRNRAVQLLRDLQEL